MGESRSRKRIREAVEATGREVEDIDWQPIGQNIEMQGREGGWTVIAGGEFAVGHNVDDVIEAINYWRES